MAMKPKNEIKKTKLREWIAEVGHGVLAKALRVSESTVMHWARGYTLPNDELKLKIEKLSRGKVSLAVMITEHYAKDNLHRFAKKRVKSGA